MRQDDVPCCEPMFWVYLTTCLGLVSFAGLTSGLALGLLSFTQVDLEVLIKAGQPQDRDNAAKILPIVKKEHLLLCTLLISKTLAMEALPIFLDRILPSWGAILMSVILVLAFGEILPQAGCARYGLSFGAKLSILVRFLLLVLFPIAHPISKLLDWLLGKGHSVLLRRAELKTLVDLHGKESGRGGELTHEEIAIICGALDLTQKTAKDAMTPISKTFSLDVNSKLNRQTMGLIMSKGHSRIPIYSGSQTNIVGLILELNTKAREEWALMAKTKLSTRINETQVRDEWQESQYEEPLILETLFSLIPLHFPPDPLSILLPLALHLLRIAQLACLYHFIVALFKTCQSTRHLFQIQAHLITSGLFLNPFLAARVLQHSTYYCDINCAVLVFRFIESPHTYCVNTLIRAYSVINVPHQAVAFYFEMLQNGFFPNSFTYPPLISSCAKYGRLENGKKCHGQAVKNGVDDVLSVRTL